MARFESEPRWGGGDSQGVAQRGDGLAAGVAARAAATNGVIRIKAGANRPFTDSSGNVWQAELGFNGGGRTNRDANLPIANTKDPGLYRSEHFSMNSFTCDAPNGKYLAKLHFAETHQPFTHAGQRVFSFNVQGREFKDFDICEKAGGQNRAYIESVPLEVTNGKFSIAFTAKTDHPAINAVELVRQGGSTLPAPVAVQGVIRIKAGSATPFTDSNGNVWQPELGFEGGNVDAHDAKTTIANTPDPGLYLSEHFGMDSFSCSVPNGKYLAKLHFAETFNGVKGEGFRVFSFNIQGQEFKDFDVWKMAGGANRAYVETVPVEVRDGKFTITFTSQVENPEINAIELALQTSSAPATAPASAAIAP